VKLKKRIGNLITSGSERVLLLAMKAAAASSSSSLRPEQKRQQSGDAQRVVELAKRLDLFRAQVVQREHEMSQLRSQLEEQDRDLRKKCKTTGERANRVNVNTLKGPPPVELVGQETAQAVMRRAMRRKEILRDQINKRQKLLGEKLAANRELKTDIDHRRRARLYHHSAVKEGGELVSNAQAEISMLIASAQRAYAEKETIVLKLGELKRRAQEEVRQLAIQMDDCDLQMEELDDECRQRDARVDEAKAEVQAALVLARQAEEERAGELERFTNVRNHRLEIQHSLDRVYDTLKVSSLGELVDAYRATGSKVLSLWGKQGELEDEVDTLNAEVARIKKETEVAEEGLHKWRMLAISRNAITMGTSNSSADLERQTAEKGALLTQMCAQLTEAFLSIPLLAAQLEKHEGGTEVLITPASLLEHLALVEALVVRLVGKTIAAAAALPPVDYDEDETEAQTADGSEAPLSPMPATGSRPASAALAAGAPASEPVSAPASVPEAAAHGSGSRARRGRVGVQAPTIEAPLSLTSHHDKDLAPSTGMEKMKYGRASLRSELMDQVLSGVQAQMDRIAEEEREAARGIDPAKVDKMNDTRARTSAKLLDRAQRDATIDEWLQRRRGHASGTPPPPLSFNARGGLTPSNSNSQLQGQASRVDPAKPVGRNRSAPSDLRTNRSEPNIFRSGGGREIFDHVTRISQDKASSRAFAAETLPKLPGLTEAAPSYGEESAAAFYGRAGADQYGSSDDQLHEPRREIEDITRRLEQLEQERRQIQHLKHLALASANLAPAKGPPPAPLAQPRGLPPAPSGLGGSASHGSMPTLGPLGSSGSSRPLGQVRSTSNVSLQPIAGVGGRQAR